MEDIIITAITTCILSAETLVTALIQRKAMDKHAAKQSILQLIMEDHIAVSEGKLPTNYQNVLLEYDIYKKSGGNSYITQRVEEYTGWHAKIEKEWKKNGSLSSDTKESIK